MAVCKTRTLIFCVFFVSAVISSFSQQTKILTAEKHNEYGLIYSLPVTSFEIEVISTKETRKAGPFYPYAMKYVGTDKVVKEDEEVWTIKEVRINPVGIPDNESQYLMQLKPGTLTYIAVDDNDMLLAINARPDSPVTSPKFISQTSGIDLDNDEYLQYMGEDFIGSISSAKKAQLLAEELLEIRDAKISLTRGTAETMPADGRQLELMLNSLERQEAALTAAFLGNVTSETVYRKFSYTPEGSGKDILFRMSDFMGPVDADDYSGDPVYIEVEVLREGELPVDNKGEEKKLPKDAVAYCIPGVANITLTFKGETLLSEEHELSQLGVVFGLNPSIFTDKKEPSYAIFDPSTGALKELGTIRD